MSIIFTAHNIRLDDGTLTKPDAAFSIDSDPRFLAARRILETLFPGTKDHLRMADIGCLEGGYAVEFARMGFQVLGVEVRQSNIDACNHVKSKTNLPNLGFIKDDAWNISAHGQFDAIFCCGLLYHLEDPRRYLDILSSVTKKLLILQTHFATSDSDWALASYVRKKWRRLLKKSARSASRNGNEHFGLSSMCEHEGVPGRWFIEYPNEEKFRKREHLKWASWDNRRSFWPQREYLIQMINDVGFDIVMEQYDGLNPGIAENMISGHYKRMSRGTFIGLKNE